MVLERKGRVSNKCVLQKGTATIRKCFHVLQYTTAIVEGRLYAPANVSFEMYSILTVLYVNGSGSSMHFYFDKR
jgi:hypothetical protein